MTSLPFGLPGGLPGNPRFAARAGILILAYWLCAHPSPAAEIRVATYNVENYLQMTRRVDGRLRQNAGKPEPEKQAVARMIADIRPDILGLMEIGEPRQLEDLRRRLVQAGLDFPHSEYLQAADPSRHLVLLSRFPIVERHSLADLPLRLGTLTLHSPRGLLDVTVETSPGNRLRILCLHLKAKLEVAEYDERQLREAEAESVRRHVRDILRADPETRLVVMGDFNATKNERSLRTLAGKPEWPDSLRPLPLADDRGESWTEYWGAADIYSRIDYIMVSRRLEPDIDPDRSGIARPSFWKDASDHCPLFVSIKVPDKEPPASP